MTITAKKMWRAIKIEHLSLPSEEMKEIATLLGCTLDTVRNALILTNPRQGEQPNTIRQMAMDRQAVRCTKVRWIAY